MPLLKSLYATELGAAKLTALLKKIRINSTAKSSRFIVKKGLIETFHGNELVSFVVDETLATGTLVFTSKPGYTGAGHALLAVQDLTYTAVKGGTRPIEISIAYTAGGTAGAEVVTVVGNAISVQIASGVSTATQIAAKINASAAALALISVAITGVGSNTQVTAAAAFLAGGSDLHTFNKADIIRIRRLRTKKYVIYLNASANPA